VKAFQGWSSQSSFQVCLAEIAQTRLVLMPVARGNENRTWTLDESCFRINRMSER
jgi:hypothetical protein